MHKKISVLMALSLLATSAVAKSNCDQQAEAEQLRVSKELSASTPDPNKNNTATYQAWLKRMHEQLEAIAKKHEECRKASKNTPSGISAQKREECLSMIIRKQQTLELQYKKPTLTAQEQASFRAEEHKIQNERQACLTTFYKKS